MKKFVFLLFLIVVPLSACKTTVKGDAPDVTVKGDGYEVKIEDDHDHHPHGGKFCPPGQAKKGNC